MERKAENSETGIADFLAGPFSGAEDVGEVVKRFLAGSLLW